MKKFMKKLAAAGLAGMMLLALAACNGTTAKETEAVSDAGAALGSETQKTYKIGVIQYATHASLDNCYTGFVEGLAECGIIQGENLTIDFQNAQGDMSNSDLQAKNMVTSQYDLIMAIATPAAMSAYSAAKDTDIPVIFNAVSDPLAAGIVETLDRPGTNCTGSADVLDFDAQLAMIRAFLPDAKKIGVIYTTSEANSVSMLDTFGKLAPQYGFEVVSVGVTNASEVATAAASIVNSGVDCINNFTDNNVVDNLSSVLNAANNAGIPVFGSEVEQVKNGCLASESIDYVELGRVTGRMAAKILLGEADASTSPVSTTSTCTPVYNPQVAEALGVTLPEAYASAEAVSK